MSPSIGVISLGEMGLGVTMLLKHHGYRVLTTLEGRSERTAARAKSAGVEVTSTDTELVSQASYILSIVPPRDAHATAQRIATALRASPRPDPLHFLDLNAISPAHCRSVAALFDPATAHFTDGGIIGGPPKSSGDGTGKWSVPRIPLSGPHALDPALAALLNARHVSPAVGAASGLKMCFASLTKGFTALAVQSFATARALGVLDELQDHLAHQSPKALDMARNAVKMPPKAYRWVREMEEIGATFEQDGGWGEDERIFANVAGIYKFIAEDAVLGTETTEVRKRGRTVEDLADVVSEALKKRKADKGN